MRVDETTFFQDGDMSGQTVLQLSIVDEYQPEKDSKMK
jgi:hypothetical protein